MIRTLPIIAIFILFFANLFGQEHQQKDNAVYDDSSKTQSSEVTDSNAFNDRRSDPNVFPVNETKFFGDYTIESNTVSIDHIRIIGGSLNVYGTVSGIITVIGGDVYLYETALVEGEIFAIGGHIHEIQGARISGKVVETNLKEGVVYRESVDEAEVFGETYFEVERNHYHFYHSWIHPEAEWFNYNRHEGFVLTPFNYQWDRDHYSDYKLNLTLGYRFGQKELHGRLTFEKSFFTNRNFILFTSLFQDSRTDDFYRLPQTENSLAALVARQDFYDRWDEQGWEFGIAVDLNRIKGKVRWASVNQSSMDVVDIWSVFNRDRLLRLNNLEFETDIDYTVLTLAYRSKAFNPLTSGIALFLESESFKTGFEMTDSAEEDQKNVVRTSGLAMAHWEFSEGILLRVRLLGGTSKNLDFAPHRLFAVGGLGSVSAHPYKYQEGDEFIQSNLELVFTSEFLSSDWMFKFFADVGQAWFKKDQGFGSIFNNNNEFLHAVGLGIGMGDHHDWEWGVNIARPTDGREGVETTLRLNLNF
jgi:hypothetical protein